MKIVYLFNGRLPTEKAHGLQIVKMCEAFAESGDQVALLSSYRVNSVKDDIFSFYGLKRNFRYRKVASFELSWIPGKVFYHIQTVLSALLLVLFTQRYRGRKTIFYARDYWTLFFLSFFGMHPIAEIHDYRFKKSKRFIQFVINNSRRIVVNSKGTQNLLSAHYVFPESKILIAPNGVDLIFFESRESKTQAREKLGISTSTVIGYTGRLETAGMDKGIGLLIEAFNLMAHKDASLYIVGGPNEQIKYFKEKVQKFGLEKKIIFTGQVLHSEIPRYLRAMDIVVIPLDSNQHALTTSPIKLFEYMAAGKTVVASDLAGLREIIGPSQAVFFKPGDAHDLAVKLDGIISDPARASELAKNGFELAKRHSWLGRAQTIKRFILSDAN